MSPSEVQRDVWVPGDLGSAQRGLRVVAASPSGGAAAAPPLERHARERLSAPEWVLFVGLASCALGYAAALGLCALWVLRWMFAS